MDRCQSCLNILPRTVDRCPVCGHVPESAHVDPIEPTAEEKRAPWAGESSRRAVNPQSAPEFLGSMGSAPDPVAAKPKIASPRSGRTPKRLGHDGATSIHEGVRTAKRSSDYDLPESLSETRSVQAGSIRVSARMRLGKSERHRLYTSLSSVLAALALIAGSSWGYITSDGRQGFGPREFIPVTLDGGSLEITEAVANFDPMAMVQVSDNTCGATTGGIAVVLESGAVLTSQRAVQTARRPVIQFADGSRVLAQLVGWDEDQNIAVLEPTEEPDARTSFGSTGRIREGAELAVVSGSLGEISLIPVVVKDFQFSSQGRESFSVVRATADLDVDSAPTLRLLPSTPVLDRDGRVVGVGSEAGTAVLAESIKSTVGALRVSPDRPSPTC